MIEKVKILLLGNNRIAQYAYNFLHDREDCKIYVIGDGVNNPSLPKGFKPDVAFSIKYPHILSKSFIDSVGVPILNFHTAPLPELRGVDTCSWAIIHRLKRFGVTVHIIDEKVDHGPILLKKTYFTKISDTANSLYLKNQELLKKIIKENIIKFVKGKYGVLKPTSDVSYFHKKGEFDYTDLEVDISKPLKEVDTFIRSRIFPGKQLPYIVIGDNWQEIIGCQLGYNDIELKLSNGETEWITTQR